MFLQNKTFLSGFYIFIKIEVQAGDEEILELLELEDYELVKGEQERKENFLGKRYVFLAEDGTWTHIMDDGYYTLWHDQKIRDTLEGIAKYFDVFHCSVGDSDNSFDFVYYKKGELIRAYGLDYPNYVEGKVARDIGTPLPIEAEALALKSPKEKVLTIAKSLGINIEHDLDAVRCYGRMERKEEQFIFNQGEY